MSNKTWFSTVLGYELVGRPHAPRRLYALSHALALPCTADLAPIAEFTGIREDLWRDLWTLSKKQRKEAEENE